MKNKSPVSIGEFKPRQINTQAELEIEILLTHLEFQNDPMLQILKRIEHQQESNHKK